MTALLSLAFFLSGASALIFETLWFRLAALTFGNSVWASSLVLSSFMAGLAIGNAWATRRASTRGASVRLYARLELAIGVSGMVLVLLLPWMAPLLAPIFRFALDWPLALDTLRLLGAFAMLLVPSTAMGATLPILVKALSAPPLDFGRALGRLYGWNTLGAVAGALAGEGLLIERFGLRGTGVIAAILNLSASVVASRLARRWPEATAGSAASRSSRWGMVVPLLAAAFVSGGVLLAFEVVSFRFLLLFAQGTSRAFAVMLSAVLAGIGLGGLASATLFRWVPQAFRAVSTLAFLTGTGLVLTYACFERVVSGSSGYAAGMGELALIAMPLVFPISFLSGLLFTGIGRALQEHVGEETRTAGVLTVANTLGAMVGALAAGFLFLPRLGIERSIFALALAYGVVGLCLLFDGSARGLVGRFMALGSAGLLLAALLAFPFGLQNRYLANVVKRFEGDGARVVLVRESLTETILYFRKDLLGRPLWYRLVTNGFSMAGSEWEGRRYTKAFAYLGLLLQPRADRALLISYGVGCTARGLLEASSLSSIDVVDISRDIVEAGRGTCVGRTWPFDDPRVHLHVEDGRFFLLTTPERFDLITGEPPPPKLAGIVNLYTREYFSLVRARLTEGGVATYWLPMFLLEPSDGKAVARAFCSVFEDCTLWTGAGLNWILAGSRGGVGASRAGEPAGWASDQGAEDRRQLGFAEPAWLAATFLGDQSFLRGWAGETPPLEDNWPYRLSPHPHSQDGLQSEYRLMMDATQARRRFEASPWVRKVFPAALREAAIGFFDAQAAINDGDGLGSRSRFDAFEATSRVGAPLHVLQFILGTTPDEVRIGDEVARAGGTGPGLAYVLGTGALAEGDIPEALRQLGPLQARNPDVERLAQLLAIALCRAGRDAEARELAKRWSAAPPHSEGQAFWPSLISHCNG